MKKMGRMSMEGPRSAPSLSSQSWVLQASFVIATFIFYLPWINMNKYKRTSKEWFFAKRFLQMSWFLPEGSRQISS